MSLVSIWAQATNGAIGYNGDIPWHVPEDMAFFKRATLGHGVIMGRTTWESIPTRFRPLPGRENLVLTNNPAWNADGAHVIHNLDDINQLPTNQLYWIMGGASIYRQTIDLVDAIVITDIDTDVPDADAFAPQLPSWCTTPTWCTDWHMSQSGLRYRFRVLTGENTPPEVCEHLSRLIIQS